MKRVSSITMALVLLLMTMAGCGKQTSSLPADSNVAEIENTENHAEDIDNTEKTVVEVSADEMKEAYLDFLKGNINTAVKNPNIEWADEGKEISYEEMNQNIIATLGDLYGESKLADASYAFIDCGADDIPELALKQVYSFDTDEATVCSIFKYIDGQIYLVSSRYGFYRSFVDVNEYGYITYGGSGGASIYYMDYSFVNKDGEEKYLYSESDEMGYADAYVPTYVFPNSETPEGYPEDIYSYDDDYITCVTYNLTEYVYEEGKSDEEYHRNNFYSFYDADGNYYAPNEELDRIYKENGITYYELSEAEKKVKEHVETLGVTDQIREGKEIQWNSLLAEGIGQYSRVFTGAYGIMNAIPGKWKMPEDTLAEGIESVFLEIDETGEFTINVKYTDEYTSPAYANGHLVLDNNSYYDDKFYFYPHKSNVSQMEADTYVGSYGIEEYLLDSKQVKMTLSSDEATFFESCTIAEKPVFEKAYEDATYETYHVLYNPSEEYYINDYEENLVSREVTPVKLKLKSYTENDITDEDVWFDAVGMDWNQDTYSDDTYTYRLGGDEQYYRKTILYVYDKESQQLIGTYDFHNYIWAEGYENNSFVDRRISYAMIKDNVLYVNLYHNTYADSCPSNAYVVAIDMSTGSVIWKTRPLVSNSHNFLILGDNIITGYGFSAEDHYLTIINRFTGEVMDTETIRKSPEYFYYKDNVLYVRTYSYDYEFDVTQ